MSEDHNTDGRDVLVVDREKEKQRLKPPPKYIVVMHNDDFTPMNFVVDMLTQYFGHSTERANQIMLDVHQKGQGVAGIYPKDIAETKVYVVMGIARENEHPFRLTVEPEPE